jgi:hypothetical protein
MNEVSQHLALRLKSIERDRKKTIGSLNSIRDNSFNLIQTLF